MRGDEPANTARRDQSKRDEPMRTSPLRQRLPIVLGAATGILVCGVVLAAVLLLGSRPAPPDPAAQALCGRLQSQDYTTTYTNLSNTLKQKGTQAQFVASQRELDIVSGVTRSCGFAIEHNDGLVATVQFTLTRDKAGIQRATARFIHDSGVWLLDYYDASVI